jgi:hypothetical protein
MDSEPPAYQEWVLRGLENLARENLGRGHQVLVFQGFPEWVKPPLEH